MLWQETIDMNIIPDQSLFAPGIGGYPEGQDAQQQVQGTTLHGAPTYPLRDFCGDKGRVGECRGVIAQLAWRGGTRVLRPRELIPVVND